MGREEDLKLLGALDENWLKAMSHISRQDDQYFGALTVDQQIMYMKFLIEVPRRHITMWNFTAEMKEAEDAKYEALKVGLRMLEGKKHKESTT